MSEETKEEKVLNQKPSADKVRKLQPHNDSRGTSRYGNPDPKLYENKGPGPH